MCSSDLDAHAERSGVCHLVCEDEAAAIADARALISFLPQNNLDAPPWAPTDDPADLLVDTPSPFGTLRHVPVPGAFEGVPGTVPAPPPVFGSSPPRWSD